jgi:outer membrane receptor for ferrienterochelin and colicin
MQLELVDPSWYCCGEPYQTVIANVGDAIVDGVDMELNFLASEHWSLGVVATYLFKSEIDETIEIYDERDPGYVALYIPGGTQLPLSSDTNIAAFSEFSWPVDWMGGGDAWIRLQAAYTGESYNRLVDNDDIPDGTGYAGRVQQPSYELLDLRAGFASTNWEFSAFVDNFTDERAVVYHDTGADVFWGRDNIRTLRPRTYGVSLRRYFR